MTKLGIFGMLPPVDVDAGRALEWCVEQAAGLDIQVLGGDSRAMFRWGTFKVDPGQWRDLNRRAGELGFAIEPFVRSPFDLVGPVAAPARAAFLGSVRAARELGGPVMRTAYGDQTLGRTRFGPSELGEHLRRLAANLEEAAAMADAEGVVLAIENHTDFSGREWATVFEQVGSPSIACAFDCANGLTVFSNPAEDALALAHWSVTTHIKDLEVVENSRPEQGFSPLVPFTLRGCPIGDGDVDVRRAVSLLFSESGLGTEIPLIVEPSWPPATAGDDLRLARNRLLRENLRRLRLLVEDLNPTSHAR